MHIPYIGIGLIDEDIINIKINQKNINLTKEDEERNKVSKGEDQS